MNPHVLRLPRWAGALRARAVVITLACAGMLGGPLAVRARALPSGAPLYTVTDLGTLGGPYSSARAINNLGQVVGSSNLRPIDTPLHAFLYDSTGMHDLGVLGGDPNFSGSEAVAINDAGQIVGSSGTAWSSLTVHAFLYDSSGMHDLGPSGPSNPAPDFTGQSYASAINGAGQVVGTEIVDSPVSNLSQDAGFLWQNGVVQPLDVAADANSESWAFSINASGQVLGQVHNAATGVTHAFIWKNGVAQELVTPDETFVCAMNDQGQVIGSLGRFGGDHSHAALYDDTGWHDLGTLGGAWSVPTAMNNLGQTVGYSPVDAASPPHPFLSTGGVMLDLEKLLVSPAPWDRFDPQGMNDRGQIVGTGFWHPGADNVTYHAFLLTPVPAPQLSLSATVLDFSGQPAGATQTLTLTNTGAAPLNVQGVAVTGPDAGSFHVASDPSAASLPPGESQTVAITYTPATITSRRARIAAVHTAAAGRTASLEIHDNDPHPGAPHQVKLTALGADAPAPAPTAPAAPTNLTATLTPAGQVALAWTVHSSNETALAIWRQKAGGPFVRVGVVVPHTTSFTDAGMTPNTRYTYEVRAINNTGASPWSNPVTVVTPDIAPAAPTNLIATLTAANQVALTWTVHSQNETALAIWRQASGGAFVRVGVVVPQATHFTDGSVAPNSRYTYEVRAINNSGASPWSNLVTAATLEAPPAAPTHLTATVGVGEIDLTWTSGKGDETGIAIFRQAGEGAWVRIGVVAPSATRYADRSGQAGRSYRYQVRAHNSHYASAWTNTVTVLTPAAP
jgi:probable HAF family extracellular repeat protein